MSGSLILPLALASSIRRLPPPPNVARARPSRSASRRRSRRPAARGRRPRCPGWRSSSTPPAPAPRPARSNVSVVLATAQPLFDAADRVVVADPHIGEEHLVEHRAARHLLERADVDAGLVDVEHEVGDALVLRDVGIGAGQEHADVGDLRARRPHLLPVDDPLVAVTHRRGGEAGEVGPGAGLAEELAPRLAAR